MTTLGMITICIAVLLWFIFSVAHIVVSDMEKRALGVDNRPTLKFKKIRTGVLVLAIIVLFFSMLVNLLPLVVRPPMPVIAPSHPESGHPIDVTMSCDFDLCEIYYTVDGVTDAKEGGMLYDPDSVIHVTSSQTIAARAKFLWFWSEPQYMTYAIYDSETSDHYVAVEEIVLSKESLQLPVGGAAQVLAEVLPADATDPYVIWYSADPGVVTVDPSGVVTAVKKGPATIYAMDATQRVYRPCTIQVVSAAAPAPGPGDSEGDAAGPPPGDIQEITAVSILEHADAGLYPGEQLQLTAAASPAETGSPIAWSSSQPSAVSVDGSGLVTAHEPGKTAVITASAGGKSDSVSILVRQCTSWLSRDSLLLERGGSARLDVGWDPAFYTPTVKWYSSDESVAEVDQTGRVYGGGPGSCSICVEVDGAVSRCSVKVEEPFWVVSSHLVDEPDVICVGEEFQLELELELSDPRRGLKVKWYSDNSSIASVDSEGLVTGNSAGDTIVRALSKQAPDWEHSISIHVEEPENEQPGIWLEVPGGTLEADENSVIRFGYTADNPYDDELSVELWTGQVGEIKPVTRSRGTLQFSLREFCLEPGLYHCQLYCYCNDELINDYDFDLDLFPI